MLKRLHRYTRSFFNFSHGEATGFLLMVILLMAASIGWLVYRNMPANDYTAYAGDKALLDSLLLEMESIDRRAALSPAPSSVVAEIAYFPFNPNQLPADSLSLLGMPPWLAQRIVNYRQKGGKFRQKEDLKRIYGFPDSLYQLLDPYIVIPTPSSSTFISRNTTKEGVTKEERSRSGAAGRETETMDTFDINSADSLRLQQVRGIGPVLSGRIVRFRDRLGGFTSLDQLYEVWGLDSAVVSRLMESSYVRDGFKPGVLPINTASQDELAAHPYINPQQAKLIFNYRIQHGPFSSVEDLRKIHILEADFVQKIAPYVRLE